MAIAATSKQTTDVIAPSCFDQISSLDMNLGHVTGFDDDNGMLVLTNSSKCWDEIRFAFTDLADWLTEQIQMAEETDIGDKNALKDAALEISEEYAEVDNGFL